MKQPGRRTAVILLALLAVLTIPLLSGAEESLQYIGAAELNEAIDRKTPGLVIIDSRSVHQFQEARIRGAVNIPLGEMEQDTSLPKVPKDSLLVFYCSGTT